MMVAHTILGMFLRGTLYSDNNASLAFVCEIILLKNYKQCMLVCQTEQEVSEEREETVEICKRTW